jgi:hypothetical protein
MRGGRPALACFGAEEKGKALVFFLLLRERRPGSRRGTTLVSARRVAELGLLALFLQF